MEYKAIVEKYLQYMKQRGFISGEEELVLTVSLEDCSPDLDYKNVYDKYCRSKTILIPSSYWTDEELRLI